VRDNVNDPNGPNHDGNLRCQNPKSLIVRNFFLWLDCIIRDKGSMSTSVNKVATGL
jgi:hypothetical protein